MNDEWHSRRTINWVHFAMYPWLWIDRFMFHWDVSDAWRKVKDNYMFFSNLSNGYTTEPPLEINNKRDLANAIKGGQIKAGDLVYFKKNGEVYHAAIIVDLNKKTAFYAGHTTDRRHRDLSKAIDEGVIIVRMAVNAK